MPDATLHVRENQSFGKKRCLAMPNGGRGIRRLTNRRGCPVERKRVSNKSQQTSAVSKPLSREERKAIDAVQIEDKGVETHQHQPFLSVNSGENRCNRLVCHPRKQKRKKKGDDGGHRSDSVCSVCQYGGSLILCDHCPSSYHLSCLDLEVHFPFL